MGREGHLVEELGARAAVARLRLRTDRESSLTGGPRRTGVPSAARLPVVRQRVRARARRRWLPLLARSIGALTFVIIVGLGLLYVRLIFGPVALSFLAGPIESAIAEELAGPRVQIESVALSLNDRGLLQFELKNVRVSDEGGETLVAAPSVAVSLSRTAMLRGRIAVESLDLTSAHLVLFYADDGMLSLKFSPTPVVEGTTKVSADPQGVSPSSPPVAGSPAETDALLGRIDLVKVLAEASARARRQEHAGAYLREIGLRAATVVIDNGRSKTVWQVPELDVDLNHRRTRSSIVGRAKIETADGAWELTFRSTEHVREKALKLTLSVQGLVPRTLAFAFPHLLALEGFNLPVSAEAQLEISTAGELLSGTIAVDAASGNIALPGPKAAPMQIAGGRIELAYDGESRTLKVLPSELTWDEGRIKLAGAFVHTAQGAEGPRWVFDIKATEGWVAADPQAPMRLPIDELSAAGFIATEQGRIVLDRFVIRAGGAEASAHGEISDIGGSVQARLDGKISAMPVSLFKTLWPSWLAPQSRVWAAQRLTHGDVDGGTFKIVRVGTKAQGGWTPVGDGDRFTLALEGSNLRLAMLDGWPAMEVPRALLRVEGASLEIAVPEAVQPAADGRKLTLKGTFSADIGDTLSRQGRLAVKAQGPLSLALDIVQHEAPDVLKNAGVSLAGSDGMVEGNLTIDVPLAPQPQLHKASAEGRLRIADGKIPRVLGGRDIEGINVEVDISPSAFEAKGKFLIGNVPATLTWQHVYGAPAEKQPPLRIAAVLYETERTELGLDVNDLVRGETSVEVAVTQDAKGEHHVHLRADLANAELVLEALGWHKPVGRRAVLELDVTKGTGAYPLELRNFRLDGDGIALAGWMGMGEDMRVREYRLPQFSLDVVSNFEARGKLRADNVWEVTAKGPTFDGRDLFKSFFFVPAEKIEKERPGLDLRAEFDTVLGFFETSARSVRLSMQKRANKVNQLDMRATLAGGKQLEAVVRPDPGRPRTLIAKSNDAGQVFKLVGFLPHALGGDLNMEVNIDGKGPAERSGVLTVRSFYLLGDAVSVEGPAGPKGRKSAAVREKVEFDSLRVPFSVGAGQFVMNSAAIDGPLMSATMNGRVDFRTRKVSLKGTFTPLAALNKMFSDFPILGDLLTGPNREGVFAWNFGVHGGLENPQIVVNPLSGVAPGITREMFQILPEEPPPTPKKGGKRSSDSGARASGSPVTRPGEPGSLFPSAPDVGDGWMSAPSDKK
jgi:hypothetical protein